MSEHDDFDSGSGESTGAQAGPAAEPTGPFYPAPTLMESLMTLALIGLVGYTCWVLYGPLIAQMFRDIAFVLMRR